MSFIATVKLVVSIGKLKLSAVRVQWVKRMQRNSGLTAKSELNTNILVVGETRDGEVSVTDVSDASVTQT